jgi:hypothetical protein
MNLSAKLVTGQGSEVQALMHRATRRLAELLGGELNYG